MMDDAAKKKVLARLRRIAGQVEGIARMTDEDRYCVDILLQIASAQAALGQAGKLLLRAHVLGVPVAAGVLYPFFGPLLSPVIAAAAMSFSSLSVVGNALRLRGAKI